jgi:hypothetical protein
MNDAVLSGNDDGEICGSEISDWWCTDEHFLHEFLLIQKLLREQHISNDWNKMYYFQSFNVKHLIIQNFMKLESGTHLYNTIMV